MIDPLSNWPQSGPALLILIVTVAPAVASAQDEEPLVTDRPDFTESAEAVDKGRVQLESGVTYDEVEEVTAWSLGEVLVRVGVAKKIEIRIGIDSYLDIETPTEKFSGMTNSSLGAKFELNQGGDGSPLGGAKMALIAQTTLPTGASVFRDIEVQPSLVWALAWDLSTRISLGTNLGLGLLSFKDVDVSEGSASVAFGFGLTDRWSTYAEFFGIFPLSDEGPNRAFFNAGLTYLISNNLQLDCRAGHGLNSFNPDYFVGAGVSKRW